LRFHYVRVRFRSALAIDGRRSNKRLKLAGAPKQVEFRLCTS